MDIIELVKEQADLYDIKNLEFEDSVKARINNCYNNMIEKSHTAISNAGNADTLLKIESLSAKITNLISAYVSTVNKILKEAISDSYKSATDQKNDLISIVVDAERRERGVKELFFRELTDIVEFLQEHAMELTHKYEQSKINEIRTGLVDMYMHGNTSNAALSKYIMNVLGVNQSKATEIAQTEISRARNVASLKAFDRYNAENPNHKLKKYWHGFKYSKVTCPFCREHIGLVCDVDDDTFDLPAHPRCRCEWLPYSDGKIDKVGTVMYTAEMLRNANNIFTKRTNVRYANYITPEVIADYVVGDRTEKTMSEIKRGRNEMIDELVAKVGNTSDMILNGMIKCVCSYIADGDDTRAVKMADVIDEYVTMRGNTDIINELHRLINSTIM